MSGRHFWVFAFSLCTLSIHKTRPSSPPFESCFNKRQKTSKIYHNDLSILFRGMKDVDCGECTKRSWRPRENWNHQVALLYQWNICLFTLWGARQWWVLHRNPHKTRSHCPVDILFRVALCVTVKRYIRPLHFSSFLFSSFGTFHRFFDFEK